MANATTDSPVTARVAANVRQLRNERGLTLAELSQRLADLGRGIGLKALSKLENGDRGVDVDDLVALAIALDVTPNRLLISAGAGAERIKLTAGTGLSGATAWRWASGEQALPLDPWALPGKGLDGDRLRQFRDENRPHEPPPVSFAEVQEQSKDLTPVAKAVRAARRKGVPMEAIHAFISFTELGARLAEAQKEH